MILEMRGSTPRRLRMRLNPILSLIVCASFSFLIPAAVASTPARVAIVNATAAPGSMKGLSSKNHERSNDDVNTLVLGKAIGRDIQGGAIHSYLIALSPGQYIRLVVAPRGIDVGIKLLDPRGRTLVMSVNRRYGPTPISLISTASGEFRLELSSLEKPQLGPKFVRGSTLNYWSANVRCSNC